MSAETFPLDRAADARGSAPALIDSRFLHEDGITYREYAAAVERCAAGLQSLHPHIVALAAAPSIEVVLTFWAILRARGQALMLNPKLPNEAVDRAVAWTNAERFVGSEFCAHPRAEPLTGLGGSLESAPQSLPDQPLDPSRPATVLMTSGSTGDPKFVVHSLANHFASAEAANRNIPVQPGDRWLLTLPLYHVAGIGIVMRCLHAGATVAFPDPGEDLTDAIPRLNITHVSLVATQLYRLLQDERGRAALRRLKAVLLGGSAVPEHLVRDAHELGAPIHTSYGMTETASQIACTPPGASLDKLLTSGRPLIENTLRIGGDGAIQVGGPALFLGYLDRDAAIARPSPGSRWFDTGDLGEFDDDGYLRVTGRKDNQFISGGENIQPEEIERALRRIPGIDDALVVPVADPQWGKRPLAFVRAADGIMKRQRSWNATLSETLPRYKLPIAYHPWPDEFDRQMKASRAAFAKIATNRMQFSEESHDEG